MPTPPDPIVHDIDCTVSQSSILRHINVYDRNRPESFHFDYDDNAQWMRDIREVFGWFLPDPPTPLQVVENLVCGVSVQFTQPTVPDRYFLTGDSYAVFDISATSSFDTNSLYSSWWLSPNFKICLISSDGSKIISWFDGTAYYNYNNYGNVYAARYENARMWVNLLTGWGAPGDTTVFQWGLSDDVEAIGFTPESVYPLSEKITQTMSFPSFRLHLVYEYFPPPLTEDSYSNFQLRQFFGTTVAAWCTGSDGMHKKKIKVGVNRSIIKNIGTGSGSKAGWDAVYVLKEVDERSELGLHFLPNGVLVLNYDNYVGDTKTAKYIVNKKFGDPSAWSEPQDLTPNYAQILSADRGQQQVFRFRIGSPAETQPVFDSFTDTAALALSSHSPERSAGGTWTQWTSFSNGVAAISTGNRLYEKTAPSYGNTAYYLTASLPSADYEVVSPIYDYTAVYGGLAGVMGRVDSVNNKGYAAWFQYGSLAIFRKNSSGAWTQISSSISYVLSAGNTYTLKLKMVGSTISAYVNDVFQVSVVDTTFNNIGYPGIIIVTVGDTSGPQHDQFYVNI